MYFKFLNKILFKFPQLHFAYAKRYFNSYGKFCIFKNGTSLYMNFFKTLKLKISILLF